MIRKALGTIIGGVLALALLAFVPNTWADEMNKATQLTFNQPVELPGNVVLPTGTYWFMAPLNLGQGQIVQVFNADRTQLLQTLQTVFTQRPNVTDDTQLTLGIVSGRQPAMLMSWFYPGEAIGHEFLYSPQQESRLSEGNQVTVIAGSGSVVSAE